MECKFARTAIMDCYKNTKQNGNKLHVHKINEEYNTLHKINEEYNKLFKAYPGMQISAIAASKTFLTVSKNFNKPWHPQTRRNQYIQAFSREKWQSLSEGEKEQHVWKKCKCYTAHCYHFRYGSSIHPCQYCAAFDFLMT